tara:strand:+ start:198 stop:449 length:252 start_codon:yes stop_codon:yes gene_type:complete
MKPKSSFDDKIIKKNKKEIENMNYEDSVKELDKILEHIQKDNVPVDKVNQYYIRGNLLVQHCLGLLSILEQEVTEISTEDIND